MGLGHSEISYLRAMIGKLGLQIVILWCCVTLLQAQINDEPEAAQPPVVSTGWSDEAVTIGYVTAPSVLGLMFISTLVSEWNAGYFGIPANAMIIAAPPIIYLGGRSVNIQDALNASHAKLGWTLYALSLVPTAFAFYGFTTDWGSTVPLTIASGVLGACSIAAMTSYAYGRAKTARDLLNPSENTLLFGLTPLKGGAMATLSYRF